MLRIAPEEYESRLDSLRSSVRQAGLDLFIASQNTKAYCLTLIISRAKGEKHTHIALTYVSKQE